MTEQPDSQVVAPSKRTSRNYFTKSEWKLLWKTVLGTLFVVGATAGPLIGWLIAVKDAQLKGKDDQISTLQKANENLAKNGPTNLDVALKSLHTSMARIGMAFPISTFDGRVAMGQGISGKPTPITELLAQAGTAIDAKQFDIAEEKLEAVEKLWPDFPGASYFRFFILKEKGKGYEKEAEATAERAIETMTDAIDFLKPLYEFAINQKLSRSDKPGAETLHLNFAKRFPEDTNIVSEFKRIFGYAPKVSK